MKNLNRTLNGSQCYTSFAPSKELAYAKVKDFQFLEVEFSASIKNFFIECVKLPDHPFVPSRADIFLGTLYFLCKLNKNL